MSESTGQSHVPVIVLVTGTLQGGGAERVMADLATYWADKGWQITLATWSGPEIDDFYSLPRRVNRVWLHVPSTNGSILAKLTANISRILNLRSLLRQTKPDAVLSFIDVPNIQTVLAALGLKVRVVVSERYNPDQADACGEYPGLYILSKPWRVLRKHVYKWADCVTALNADAASWLERECRVDVEVIPNALRTLPQAPCERDTYVLGAGRLVREKGFDLLIRAFARVSAGFPDWRLVIVGDGPDRANLGGLADELNLGDRIQFMAPVKDVELWMAKAGLVVIPSRFEAYGNVALESLGMGAPVIATRCSGPASFIKDNVNGRLVPVEDADALARVMAELMENPVLSAKLGSEAIKVRESHRLDLVARRWEQCLLPGFECGQTSTAE